MEKSNVKKIRLFNGSTIHHHVIVCYLVALILFDGKISIIGDFFNVQDHATRWFVIPVIMIALLPSGILFFIDRLINRLSENKIRTIEVLLMCFIVFLMIKTFQLFPALYFGVFFLVAVVGIHLHTVVDVIERCILWILSDHERSKKS